MAECIRGVCNKKGDNKMVICKCVNESDPIEVIYRTIDNGRNSFTFYIYDALRKENMYGNISASPLSLQIVLALAYTGAAGYTARELAILLKLPVFKQELFNSYATLIEACKDPVLNVATAMFVGDSIAVKKEFSDQALQYFQAGAKVVSFRKDPENAATVINNWVEKKTRNTITNFIDDGSLDPLTVMILINAVHFKANWKYPFKQEGTRKEKFYLSMTNTVETDMMHLQENFGYLEHKELEAKILQLPYEGDKFSMFVVLPDKIDGLGVMEEKLKYTNMPNVFKQITNCNVNVSIPKFEITKTMKLNDVLKSFGVVSMFDRYEADFSNISRIQMCVDEVLQKTFIKVDETGTEAAAATAIKMVYHSAVFYQKSYEFIADHPFIFIISKCLSYDRFLFIFIGRYFGK